MKIYMSIKGGCRVLEYDISLRICLQKGGGGGAFQLPRVIVREWGSRNFLNKNIGRFFVNKQDFFGPFKSFLGKLLAVFDPF